MLDALPDSTSKGFVSPPGIFYFVCECVDHYTTEPPFRKRLMIFNKRDS